VCLLLCRIKFYLLLFLSLDGKEYDPSDFDFAKIDDDEKKRDALVAAEQGVQSFYDVNSMAGLAQPLANSYPGQPMVGVKSVQQSMFFCVVFVFCARLQFSSVRTGTFIEKPLPGELYFQ